MRMTLTRMTRKRTTKKKSSVSLQFFRHPLPPFGHLNSVRRMIFLLAVIWTAGAISAPAAAGSTSAQANSHAHDFVIFATVFTDQGFTLTGARVRVRRSDEKKFRWEAVSDRRGELGIRVKQGAEYELAVEAHGFKSQMSKVDAREGDREELTLQMEPLAGGKP
jgi:hypothetical protein